MNDKKVYLFAYGSMKRGFKNHGRLINDSFIGNATTLDKYIMHPTISYNFPYALESVAKWNLIGELYELSSADIKDIDIFEGTPNHYYRKEIEVLCEKKIYNSFIYFRSENNPTAMDSEIEFNEWSLEFESVGKKYNEFSEALKNVLFKRSNNKLVDALVEKFYAEIKENEK
jgi:gamma-glutamylaminecyclotransferase